MKKLAILVIAAASVAGGQVEGSEWKAILSEALKSPRSQTRHDGLAQVPADTTEGLRAIWAVLADQNADRVDWYVRQGAYEALLKADGGEAHEAIRKVLQGRGQAAAKEAVVYSVIWKIRKEFVKFHGGNNDPQKEEEAKLKLRTTRGLEYFSLVLPVLDQVDPDGIRYEWLSTAFDDGNPRVRSTAIHGFLAYPHDQSVPKLLTHLQQLERKKKQSYKEWLLTRYALEVLTGQNFGEIVTDWLNWWQTTQEGFSVKKRVAEETVEGGAAKTKVVHDGVEVVLSFKVAGKRHGYPLLVIPWRGQQPDYFRPHFHGIEDEYRVYYIEMPRIEDFKGLKRHTGSNLPYYPTEELSGALTELMKESGLKEFAILGHGPDASAQAMIAAAKHPDQVTHIILINPRSGGSAYREAIANVKRQGAHRGNIELKNGCDSITLGQDNKPVYEPSDSDERGGLNRALFNATLADATATEAADLQNIFRLPGGTQVMNDPEWSVAKTFGGKRPKARVLVIMGTQDPWTPVGDMQKVVQLLKKPPVIRFPKCAEFPFFFEPYKFTTGVLGFLRGARKSEGS